MYACMPSSLSMLYMCENCKINDKLRTLYVFIAILDVHHQVSILAMYLNIVLGQTAVAVLLSVWILNLHFRDDNRPPCKRMRQAAVVMQIIMCKRENTSVSSVDRE